MNYWMNCSYKQDDIMQKQKFDEKELKLVEIDELFTESFTKINQQNKELRAKITQPFNHVKELQEKISKITQPFNHVKELQEKIAEANQSFKQTNKLQEKLAIMFKNRQF